MASCSLRLLLEQLVHLLIIHRLGEALADAVEALQQREAAADTLHDDAAHVLARIELGLLRQEADLDPGLWPRFAIDAACRCRP